MTPLELGPDDAAVVWRAEEGGMVVMIPDVDVIETGSAAFWGGAVALLFGDESEEGVELREQIAKFFVDRVIATNKRNPQ